MKQSAKISIAAILVIGVFSISILTVPAFADWGKFSYPQIQGTVPVSSGDDFEQKNGIALSVAMAVGENSVSDGKAVYAKLADVNGFLVHEVILITEDRGYYKVLVDAGNGEALYVSAVESEEEIKKIVDRLYEMFKGYLPLTLEEKKQKLHEYIQSLN